MDYLFWIVLLLGMLTIYRILSQRLVDPKVRVAAMLRRYRALEKAGLPEKERLFNLVSTRSSWKRLPRPFLREVVSRLDSKEDVMRFVSLSEGYGFHRKDFPNIASKDDMDLAMTEIACVLANFGSRLQEENRLKEAEFVQKLALKLQPNEHFTSLPLAVTYYRMERYAEAVPLFKDGLAQLEKYERSGNATSRVSSALSSLQSNANPEELKVSCVPMYEACLKAARQKK